ncbi:MAG: helix-turn-helix domain-containing protein [Enterobacter cloacae]|uniref:DNA-binding protein n=2 Tax=Winkia neuii TaxID=33007 RepID=A0A2I1IQH5_9ACTO|nr:helix-turn-helix domain-containing protein [Enterobacter cloacae]PKY73371.1 DNA-binding protein [Winkia neuii]
MSISKTTVLRLLKQGRLLGVRVGRIWRVTPQAIEDFAQKATQQPPQITTVLPGGQVIHLSPRSGRANAARKAAATRKGVLEA